MAIERFQLPVGGIVADVAIKNIRNLHIGVYPPDGTVRVAAPAVMDRAAIHNAVVLRLPWIKRQVRAFESQPRESSRTYRAGESHWFLGRRYRLRITGHSRRSSVTPRGNFLDVEVRGEVDPMKTARTLLRWYRWELRERAEILVTQWAQILSLDPPTLSIRIMSTRWGSCASSSKRIWLNLALSRVPPKCIEYVVVHELLHFLVRAHNAEFVALLDRHLPDWRASRAQLASLPLTAGPY